MAATKKSSAAASKRLQSELMKLMVRFAPPLHTACLRFRANRWRTWWRTHRHHEPRVASYVCLTRSPLPHLLCVALQMSGMTDVSAFPKGENLFEWCGTIKGPDETVFEGMEYSIEMSFPASYPFEAPTIIFTTPIYHPNVDEEGNICLDILKDKWSAAYSVSTVLLSLQSLLGEPNNDSPLNTEAADLWDNQLEFKKEAVRRYQDYQRVHAK